MRLPAATDRHVAERERIGRRSALEGGELSQRDGDNSCILGREPALSQQELGKDVPLQGLLPAAAQDALPGIGRDQREQVGRWLGRGHVPARGLDLPREHEPEEAVARQSEQVSQLAHGRKRRVAGQLDGNGAAELTKVELDGLGRATHVEHTQNALVHMLPNEGQHLAVPRIKQSQGTATERRVVLAHRDHTPHPVEQRRGAPLLRLHVDRLVAVDGIHDRRQVEPLRIGPREPAITVGRPLHRRAHAVPIAQIVVVAHAELVAVVDHRRTRQREQQRVHQLDLAPVVLEQRRQSAADA